jgi:hypothetical protein
MADKQTSSTTDTIQLGTSFKSNRFFTVAERKSVPLLNTTTNAVPKLVPNSGFINIKDEFRWKNYGSTDEVPSIIAREHELEYGTWARNLKALFDYGAGTVAGLWGDGSKVDPYIQMYASTKTGFTYNFPWLLKSGDNIRTVTSTWGENATSGRIRGLVEGAAGSIGGSLAASMLGATNLGFEQIQEYKETTPQSLTISFPLYNTGTVGEIYDHYCFISLFTFQNLKTRTSLMTYIAPKLYTLDSGGVGGIYWPVAYVSELKVDSIGTTRNLKDFAGFTQEGILVPEAYKVTITFKELLPQSSNIFAGSIGGKKIEVTSAIELATAALNNLATPDTYVNPDLGATEQAKTSQELGNMFETGGVAGPQGTQTPPPINNGNLNPFRNGGFVPRNQGGSPVNFNNLNG